MDAELQIKKWVNGDIGYDIFNGKYRHNNETLEEFFDRVSGGFEPIRQLIAEKKFLFGGRILANRGIKDKKVTLSNCYVLAPPEDNLESIFECSGKLARTYSYGGGCGIDLSLLRPAGATTHNASKESSGPVSFMEIFSQVTGTISQNGRRGALMISMDVNHPDIESFIDCKTDLSKVNFANISIRVNDDFMKAVEEDKDYFLRWPCNTPAPVAVADNCEYNVLYQSNGSYFKRVKAKKLFEKLSFNNWNYAEPGILYWDNISQNNMLNQHLDFAYAGTNPCAEEPLPAGGSCLLGSLNLSEFVVNPFTHKAYFDFDGFEEAVAIAVIALNQVLKEGADLHPLAEQRQSVKDWRQIGLGEMGLAEMLIKLGYRYDSVEAQSFVDIVFNSLAKMAVETSLVLAESDSCFPKCNKSALVDSNFIRNLHLPAMIIDRIQKSGLYNSQLLTCAPTGSIATMIGTSTGVEPYFAFEYTRKTKSLEKQDKSYTIYEKVVYDYQAATNKDYMANKVFVHSQNINPNKRVEMQAVLQKYIDASISSTVNLNTNVTAEEVFKLYMEAWKKGLKGLTIFRQGCARQAILSTGTETPPEPKEAPVAGTKVKLNAISPLSRDSFGKVLNGKTYKTTTACGTLYVTINTDGEGNIVELFTNSSKNGTCKANLNAETRMASLALRSGAKIEEVIDQLKGIHCQSCAFMKAKGKKLDGISCPDIIAKTLMKECKHAVMQNEVPATQEEAFKVAEELPECPNCHSKSLIMTGGCCSCHECGWSKCNN